MKTIDFDIEKAKSGEYQVVTKDGRPARIICWNKNDGDFKIVALIETEGYEFSQSYKENGSAGEDDNDLDLQLQVEDGDKLTWKTLPSLSMLLLRRCMMNVL